MQDVMQSLDVAIYFGDRAPLEDASAQLKRVLGSAEREAAYIGGQFSGYNIEITAGPYIALQKQSPRLIASSWLGGASSLLDYEEFRCALGFVEDFTDDDGLDLVLHLARELSKSTPVQVVASPEHDAPYILYPSPNSKR